MNTQGSTAKYVALSNRVYTLIVDTLDSAARSRLGYWTSVWEIASRPYPSPGVTSAIGENIERASELANLTAGEFCSRVQITADFSEKFAVQVGKLQDAVIETCRDSLKATVSTVDQVKDARVEPSLEGVSTVEHVEDASAEVTFNGLKQRKKSAHPVPATNE